MVSFFIKLAEVKHESSEAHLMKFKENLSCGFLKEGLDGV